MAAVSLTVSTVNVNGIRAAVKQRSETNLGFLPWLESSGADVVALQEVRADEEQTRKALAPALDAGWHLIGSASSMKGRAGVALLSRQEPSDVCVGYGDPEFAESGRYIEAVYPGAVDGETVTVASLYLPPGSANTPKQDEKDRFLKTFRGYLAERAAELKSRDGHEMIICGDWNIAHREEDLKNHKGNHKSSGFLPHEREWMTDVFADGSGWTDIVRHRRPDEVGPYSWWSQRGKAFDNDAGWRIDYQVVSDGLVDRAVKDWVDRAEAYDMRWSDHAPVTVVYE
ncbi:exodeoxyribonuclease III [Dietzia cinnamea]|uniref:Exodeoxyribonuclease III n=1 Tax=Dietzia cinnamea TaxID=321318 RepID=A0AAW5Q7Q3_9ACTN|nr:MULTISPECIES: exodeoxyribonuclease III [Dietzia]MCT1863049.1 exodeoxyribonuclease III [Dietzia cinnamea]MCT2029296.1 exodeoxyribonuclease III [Dietzia cinnamea]MCT2032367.1 exodeoxyribonuclease III [Dietzia cinnamea]MCT2075139.1 exodeoxyribonuclease III [Dietzia cinnamea]MCT2105416.1 exodeoxyribonuclease III [Dietzia cinnamea]